MEERNTMDYAKEAEALMGVDAEEILARFKGKSQKEIDSISVEALHLRGIPRDKARMAYDIASQAFKESRRAISDKCSLLDDKETRVIALLLTYMLFLDKAVESADSFEQLCTHYTVRSMFSMLDEQDGQNGSSMPL